jgi:hypothetical protein
MANEADPDNVLAVRIAVSQPVFCPVPCGAGWQFGSTENEKTELVAICVEQPGSTSAKNVAPAARLHYACRLESKYIPVSCREQTHITIQVIHTINQSDPGSGTTVELEELLTGVRLRCQIRKSAPSTLPSPLASPLLVDAFNKLCPQLVTIERQGGQYD